MIKVKNILFPTDFSRCASQAMEHALYLSKKYQAKLHMLHAIVLHEDDVHNHEITFPEFEVLHKALEDHSSTRMEAALKEIGKSEIEISMEQVRGISGAEVILDYAKEKDIDLIVMGTHGRRGLGHLFLGSVAEKIVQFSECPVLTIRELEKPKPVTNLRRDIYLL